MFNDTKVESFTENGFTVEIHYDSDCESPREYSNLGLFLGFPHRNKIGDETLNLDRYLDLYEVETLQELLEEIRKEHKARVVLPVGMIDHSGVAFYVGSGAHPFDPGGWDSGTCGVILDTEERRKELGCEGFTDAEITEALTAEINEYSKWAGGDCYGYAIIDRNGDTVDSCWGFIGMENCIEEAKANVPDADEQPEPLYDVRLTREQMLELGLSIPE